MESDDGDGDDDDGDTDATAIAELYDSDEQGARASSSSAAATSESGKPHLTVLLEKWLPRDEYKKLRERICTRYFGNLDHLLWNFKRKSDEVKKYGTLRRLIRCCRGHKRALDIITLKIKLYLRIREPEPPKKATCGDYLHF